MTTKFQKKNIFFVKRKGKGLHVYSIAKSRVTMFLTKPAKMCFRLIAAGEQVDKSQTATLKTASFFVIFIIFFRAIFDIFSKPNHTTFFLRYFTIHLSFYGKKTFIFGNDTFIRDSAHVSCKISKTSTIQPLRSVLYQEMIKPTYKCKQFIINFTQGLLVSCISISNDSVYIAIKLLLYSD